ncbi:glycosyltransferase [Blautia marasmi]|uniref:glycosyltransferase n=1 Tax=Blautia marasmi TaxID=1917868 RepID=UPI000CF24694|nr:glycosyltransferase [Blautia marasmi]
MIYVLYDKPKKLEDMSFLTAAFEKEYEEIYPEWRCTSIKQMFSVCSTTVKRAKAGDTVVCWYDFMGVLCWRLGKLTDKKIKVIAINILLKDKKTAKNRIAKYLYKRALCSHYFAATVTTVEYGCYINEILNTKADFTLLHDVYHQNYTLDRPVETKANTVFCGGRNGRDWKLLFEVAKALPNVTFNCVMPSALKEQFSNVMGNNVCVKTDIPENAFMEFLCQSQLIAMPLDTEAPAGLTVYFQAAANNKMIITSDTVTTKGYLSDGRGALCKNAVEDWVDKIQHYLQHSAEADACAMKFKKFLEDECSEKKYAKTLWGMLAE